MSSLNPAPATEQLRTFPTPKLRDVLFWERRPRKVSAYDAQKATSGADRKYGEPHPNKQKWPHHKLVFIEVLDDRDWDRWWYAADREHQDDYNFEITYPYGGRKEFPRITRTYVLPRAEFQPFQIGKADSSDPDALLVDHRLSRVGEPLDSLYVVYQAVFDRLPKAADVAAGKLNYGIEVGYDCLPTFPVIRWTFDVGNDYTAPAYGTNTPIPPFNTGSNIPVLTDVVERRTNDVQRQITLVYERIPGRTKINFRRDPEYGLVRQRITKVDTQSYTVPVIGSVVDSQRVISAQVRDQNCRFSEEVVETAVLPTTLLSTVQDDPRFCQVTRFSRIDRKSELTRPAQGAEFEGLRVIDSSIEDINDGILGRLVVLAATVPSPVQTSYRTEAETNSIITVQSGIVLASSVPTAPAAGTDVEQRAIGCGLASRITSSIPTPGEREECSVIDFTFPALFTAVDFVMATRNDDREFFSVEPVIRAAFRKKVKARIVITYHTTKPACSELYNILPVDVRYNGVLFNLVTGPVLTNGGTVFVGTSSSNPDWGVLVETAAIEASTPTASAYIADIGNEKLIGEDIVKWGFNLYRRTRTYIQLE